MLSSLPVLRARPSENTLKLAMVSFSAPEFSVSTESTLRNASRAACVIPCPAPGSATSVGTSPVFATFMPPSSAITGTPVSP